MIHPCPNCGKATPIWPGCPNHSYIVTTDVTSVATGNIVWPLTPSQITLTCDNCSKLSHENATLRAEVEEQDVNLQCAKRMNDHLRAEAATLRAEVERLKGERDALRKADRTFAGEIIGENSMSTYSLDEKLEHARLKAQKFFDENLANGGYIGWTDELDKLSPRAKHQMCAFAAAYAEKFDDALQDECAEWKRQSEAAIADLVASERALSQAQQALRRQAERVCMFWVRDKSVTNGNYGKMEFKEEDVQRTIKKWLAEAALPSDAPQQEKSHE